MEYDAWDHRGGTGNSLEHFGFTSCENTLFVACKAEDDVPVHKGRTDQTLFLFFSWILL